MELLNIIFEIASVLTFSEAQAEAPSEDRETQEGQDRPEEHKDFNGAADGVEDKGADDGEDEGKPDSHGEEEGADRGEEESEEDEEDEDEPIDLKPRLEAGRLSRFGF